MERMDHFQTQQDQQTLILREIQQHLGLVPPAPPVAVPSTVAAEDPPIHQRSLLLDHTITPLLFCIYMLHFGIFNVLTAFGSLKQVKQRRKPNKQSKEKQRGQQLQSYFEILEHFPKSIFSYYIPFQSSRSQESNASNHVRFGVEMRKIWPSEANCSSIQGINFVDTPLKLSYHESNRCPKEITLCELHENAKRRMPNNTVKYVS
ncbi:hypothetical protein AAG906_010437 [Vitis piasezkii]